MVLTSDSFLPLVDICDNFKVSAQRGELVPFCLTRDPRTAVGLLWPEVVQALKDDNARAQGNEQVPSWVLVEDDHDSPNALPRHVHFASHLSTPLTRSAALAATCLSWRDSDLFASVIGGHMWRDELYAVYRNPLGPLTPAHVEFEVERAASSLFGVVTYGVHMTVYRPPVLGSDEEMMIWVPTRAKTKQTWPGYLDNTVAGGIPSGMTPTEAIVKEAMEEASLAENVVRKHTRAVGAVSYFFQKNGRWLQPEIEYTYDLMIPPDTSAADAELFIPKPLDGEVEAFECLPLSEVIKRMKQKLFKPNCAIVLIDFLIRHGLITAESEPNYLEILSRLHGQFEYDLWKS